MRQNCNCDLGRGKRRGIPENRRTEELMSLSAPLLEQTKVQPKTGDDKDSAKPQKCCGEPEALENEVASVTSSREKTPKRSLRQDFGQVMKAMGSRRI